MSPPPIGEGFPTAGMGVHLDAPGQLREPVPSSVRTQHRAVKQGKSGGSVGTTSRGKGKGCREVGVGPRREREGTRGCEGDGHRHLRRQRIQGKGSSKWRCQLQTTTRPGVMPTPPPPMLPPPVGSSLRALAWPPTGGRICVGIRPPPCPRPAQGPIFGAPRGLSVFRIRPSEAIGHCEKALVPDVAAGS